ncbi:cytosine permease [Treponema parvum]|uniref:Cytosine permease n=1 Tax=Treponema parvum TaxID=138851 RepID=A0A975IF21_9SPIR|nr:cytosine permease [Treponema parvum]QTQ13874.1 cytosine permease [Treponema parvum]
MSNESKTTQTANDVNDSYVEYDVYEPVSSQHRYSSFRDMASTWTVANANPTSWYVGSTLGILGFGAAMAVTMLGNIATYLILAIVGAMGFVVGTSNMGLARVPFGIVGSKAPSVVNALQFVGWCGVNTYIAAIPLSNMLSGMLGLPATNVTLMFSVLIIMAITALISLLGGSRTMAIAQSVAVICLIILSVWLTIRIFQNFAFKEIMDWVPPADSGMTFGSGIDALAALGFAWIMAVADYTRYTKTKQAATIAPMLGATFGMVWFCLIGSVSAIAVAIQNGVFDPNMSDPGSVASMLGMGQIANIMIVVSTIAVNMINVYSGGYSTSNFSTKLKPRASMTIIAILATILALVPFFLGSFLDTFQAFLGYLGAVFPPCIAIMIADYVVIRKKNYVADDFNKKGGLYWYNNGVNWRAIVVWLLGAICYFISLRIPFIMDTIGAVFTCFIFTFVVYVLVGKEKNA